MISISLCLIDAEDSPGNDVEIWSGELSHSPAIGHTLEIRNDDYSSAYRVIGVHWILHYPVELISVSSSALVYVEPAAVDSIGRVATS